MRADVNETADDVDETPAAVDRTPGDVGKTPADVAGARSDVVELQAEVRELRTDAANLPIDRWDRRTDVGRIRIFVCEASGYRTWRSGVKRSGNKMAKWVKAACHPGPGLHRFVMLRRVR